MTFAEWYAMPSAERWHRKLLYLADRQRDLDAMDEAQRDQWARSLQPATERDFHFT